MFLCLAVMCCLPNTFHLIKPFKTTGFMSETSDSAKTQAFLDHALGYDHRNQFIILYRSDTLKAKDPRFLKEIETTLEGLHDLSLPYALLLPDKKGQFISKDKHSAYVILIVKKNTPLSDEELKALKAAIHPSKYLKMWYGGQSLFEENINEQTQDDLYRADKVALPVSIIALLLILGSVVSAGLPLILGGCCALFILNLLYGLAQLFNLSIFTLNIALLLGLCLNLDYALFIISRFREERLLSDDLSVVISRTLATAGRAVFFSGLAVFISLSALLFFPVNILFSIGVGGLCATFIAVMMSVLVLPACLCALDKTLEWGSLNIFQKKDSHIWRSIAEVVVRRPVFFFMFSLTLLLCLGYPFLTVDFGVSDHKILPEHAKGRAFFDEFYHRYPASELDPIQVVISKTSKESVQSTHALAYIASLTETIEHQPLVLKVHPMQSKTFMVLQVFSKHGPNHPSTEKLIETLRTLSVKKGWTIGVTGTAAQNLDVRLAIFNVFPYAMTWIVLLTYLILMCVLRSLFLPLKAIFMNILSLSACYGVMAYVFDEGHFHQFLHFVPQGMLDLSLLIIIFCAIFGFSMDYEVFLLSRIQEAYLKTKNNQWSIIFGIAQSSWIITSAALIVICMCGSFMVADVLMVKEFGLGIAIAIFVDAFIIRTLLVPSTMVLMKSINWYFPQWLSRGVLPHGIQQNIKKECNHPPD